MGTVKLFLGAEAPYVGSYTTTEDYELHSISYSCNADGVAVAAYNDPKTLHSLSPSLTTETFVVLEHAARDNAVKVKNTPSWPRSRARPSALYSCIPTGMHLGPTSCIRFFLLGRQSNT